MIFRDIKLNDTQTSAMVDTKPIQFHYKVKGKAIMLSTRVYLDLGEYD